MKISLFNTMSRTKEIFQPIKVRSVKIYSCGPTVYNYAHIGNLRAYVFADILKRMFLINKYKVRHIINLTDVGHLYGDDDNGEDKIEIEAKKEKKTAWEIAEFYTKAFKIDLNLLNILQPDFFCRATNHIPEMISMIKNLEAKGFTYIKGGNVYYDTSKFKDYAKLAHLKLSPDTAKTRIKIDPNKKSQFDFVLWFTNYKYKQHEMLWNSPWGKGFPGWHIECSAMASKYLGEHFDIHTGGIDHISVHHTNEIAQSEGVFGHRWVEYWLHCNFLMIKNEAKMAKSDNNFLTLQKIIDAGYTPDIYRFYLLGGHYRSPMLFSFEALDGAKIALGKLKARIIDLKRKIQNNTKLSKEEKHKQRFIEVINDDLNTPKGLAILWKVVNATDLPPSSKLRLLSFFDTVLGLNLMADPKIEKIPDSVFLLAEERLKLRKSNEWDKSDKLRKQIIMNGYDVIDLKKGYKLKKRPNFTKTLSD